MNKSHKRGHMGHTWTLCFIPEWVFLINVLDIFLNFTEFRKACSTVHSATVEFHIFTVYNRIRNRWTGRWVAKFCPVSTSHSFLSVFLCKWPTISLKWMLEVLLHYRLKDYTHPAESKTGAWTNAFWHKRLFGHHWATQSTPKRGQNGKTSIRQVFCKSKYVLAFGAIQSKVLCIQRSVLKNPCVKYRIIFCSFRYVKIL